MEAKRKTRNESKFRNVESQNGEFSCKIDKKTTGRITRYCKLNNLNRTKFVIEILNERLDQLERDQLQGMSKDELINLIMEGK